MASLASTSTLHHIKPLLQPIIALNLWTFFMEAWMYATRLPALQRAQESKKLAMTPDMTKQKMNEALPYKVRNIGDNFNHLLEQPQQFYAVVGVLVAIELANFKTTGAATGIDVWQVRLAWSYVVLRVAHSVWQAVVNDIPVRFMMFSASSAVLLGMTVRAAMTVF